MKTEVSPDKKKNLKNDSIKEFGEISCANGNITWKFSESEKVEIDLSEIVIIGEWTNDLVPFQTDWYLVLIKKNGNRLDIPLYALIFDDFFEKMSDYFGSEIKQGLVTSTEIESRTIWPEEFLDQKLFEVRFSSKKSLLHKLKSMFVGDSYHLKLSEPLSHLVVEN